MSQPPARVLSRGPRRPSGAQIVTRLRREHPAASVAALTFYKGQLLALRHMLAQAALEAEAHTVDSCQGSEFDYVVVSMVGPRPREHPCRGPLSTTRTGVSAQHYNRERTVHSCQGSEFECAVVSMVGPWVLTRRRRSVGHVCGGGRRRSRAQARRLIPQPAA